MKKVLLITVILVGAFIVGNIEIKYICPFTAQAAEQNAKAKVTFVELGSVNCIPCKAMQPIMKQVESRFKGQVNVVFYDVWTSQGEPYGQKYAIRAIPTQVFLDESGKEYFRHEGYFPYEEVVSVLNKKGVK